MRTMIWIRRLISIPLGIIFFVLLLAAVVILQVHDMFLEPDFYTEELEEANAYEFLLGDLLTSALEDARKVSPGEGIFVDLKVNPVIESRLASQEIVSAVNRAIPPAWLQEQVEEAFDQFGSFLALERDEFEFTVRAGEQVPIIVKEIKDLLRIADAYNLLFEEVLVPAVREGVTQELPLGLEVPSERLVSAIRTIVPPEWVRDQVEGAMDEASAYMVGQKDSLEISVQLGDRVDIALNEIKAILRDLDVYDVLYDEVVAPQLLSVLGDTVGLPAGIAVTHEEVVSSLRQVAPVDWVRDQVERVIDEAGPYLAGRKDSFAVRISLADNKRQARRVIMSLLDEKLREAVNRLPQCGADLSLRDLQALEQQTRRGESPQCIPAGVDLAAIIGPLRAGIGDQVDGLILGSIPESISFTTDNLLETLRLAGAQENIDRIDEVREVLRDGWTYTDEDLRQDLLEQFPDDGHRVLDDIRSYLTDGWTYAKEDLRRAIPRQRPGSEADTLDDIKVNLGFIGTYTAGEVLRDLLDVREPGDVDRFRGYLKNARDFRWLVYLPAVLLLLLIGFLAGRGWHGRLYWASLLLVVSATVLLVAFGPVYTSFADSGLEDLRAEATASMDNMDIDPAFDDTRQLLIDKVLEVVESVADEFAFGIMRWSVVLLVIGLAGLVGSVAWGRSQQRRRGRRRRRRRVESQIPGEELL